MKIYVSRKNPEVTAKLDEAYSTETTVILDYLTGDKKDSNTCITKATLKRWWKETEVEETLESVEPPCEETLIEVDNPEVPAESTTKEVHPSRTKRVSTPKVDRTKNIEEVESFLTKNYDIKYCESVKCYKVFKNNKTVAEVYLRRKAIEIRVKTINPSIPKSIKYKDGYKYYLPIHYFVEYSMDYIKILQDLI